jgi:SPP1 family predicted phage head-tail adaptor
MALIHDPSRLNQRISFGATQSVENDNGVSVPTFVPQQTVYCGRWSRTFSQTFQAIGTVQQDDITVIIRHNSAVNNSLQAQFVGGAVTYKVVTVNPDESDDIVTYDLVQLRKVSK